NVRLDDRFPASPGVAVPFPADRAVLDELIAVFQNKARRPAHVIFVLDFSGSMCGPAYRRGSCDSPRITELRSVFAALSGSDTSISGQLTGFRQREKLTVIRYGGKVLDEREFTVDGPRSAALGQLRDYLGTNSFDGNTAVWTALAHAYDRAGDITSNEPDHLVSIVLMTDGQNNSGITLGEFLGQYAKLPAPVHSV